MSPTQKAIVAVLADGEWHTAKQIRDVVSPGTGVVNIHVQIYRLRESGQANIEGDRTGPGSRGCRLVTDEVPA
jgi:hypothetical protein